MKNQINFISENLRKNYQAFLAKTAQIHDFETEFEKQISFVGSLLFDDNGVSEVARAGSDVQIANYVMHEAAIDLIWYDSNVNSKKHPVVFLKYFDIAEQNLTTDILENQIRNEITAAIQESVLITTKWKDSNNEGKVEHGKPYLEKAIDDINRIIQEIDDDELYYNDNKIKHTKIDFSLTFVFGNLNKYQPQIERIINEVKKDIYDYDKVTDKFEKRGRFRIFFESDLEQAYSKLIANRFCVERDHVVIDNSTNVLLYDAIPSASPIQKAAIANVSAKSIHRLWNQPNYQDNLLGLNLRYHLKKSKSDKEIDQHINESMNSDINYEFWLKNNGLVIICSQFEIQNNKIILENFSIVNGGQTTVNIGTNNNFNNLDFKDFLVAVKIIAVQGMSSEPGDEVISIANKIAEATNSQKPIKKEDLLVNIEEIKNVRRAFEKNSPKISMRTRRGESNPRKDWFPEKWQDIEYSRIMQISAAFDRIMPGTARNQKKQLFDSKNAKEIFGDFVINNISTYSELIKFNAILNKLDNQTFLKKLEKHPEFGERYSYKSQSVNNFLKYCKFFSISLIRILKIFLFSKEAIKEYEQILDQNISDSDAQSAITEWSKKWWNQITNKQLFIKNDWESIEHFWINLVIKQFSKYFLNLYSNPNEESKNSPTNITKINKSFYRSFMMQVIDDFFDLKAIYAENIVVEIGSIGVGSE